MIDVDLAILSGAQFLRADIVSSNVSFAWDK